MSLSQVKNTLLKFHKVLQSNTNKDYLTLKVRLVNKGRTKDIPLFLWLQKKAVSSVATWPEWAVLLDEKKSQKSSLNRYAKKQDVSLEPDSLHKDYQATTKLLLTESKKYVEKSIFCSLHRFEENTHYQNTLKELQQAISVAKLKKIPEALPLLDIMSPQERLGNDIVNVVIDRIQDRFKDLKQMPFPYRKGEYLSWNLAVILRVQAQLKTNYSDRISKITAAAENNFYQIFYKEILEQEVFSCIVKIINNNNILGRIMN